MAKKFQVISVRAFVGGDTDLHSKSGTRLHCSERRLPPHPQKLSARRGFARKVAILSPKLAPQFLEAEKFGIARIW